MTDNPSRHQLAAQRVVHAIAGMEAAPVRLETYRVTDAGSLTMDLYYPAHVASGTRLPAVVLVTGYTDAGAQRIFGVKFRGMGSFVSWSQLIAASGLVAIVYENDAPSDAHHVLRHLQQHAAALGIDTRRVGLWACSGHGSNALSLLMDHRDAFACALLAYPYTLDLDGSTKVTAAAGQFGFVTPAAGRTVADLPTGVPLLLVRAGNDQMPGLNDALDSFAAAALAANLPVTIRNYPEGPHAFDLFDDRRTSRAIVKEMLAFLQVNLSMASA